MTDLDDRPAATGADFAGSFVRSFPMSGNDRMTLAAWFDLAIDAGRRQARADPPDPFVHLNVVDEQCGRLAVRPEAISAVIARPDATVIVVLGQRIAVVEEYEDVLSRIGRRP